MKDLKKIAFFGSDGIGLDVLNWLVEHSGKDFHFAGVVSGKDQPAGRGKKLTANPIVARARELHLNLLQPEATHADTLHWVQQEKIDLAIVFAYGHLLKQEILDAVPLGFINLHASLLPKYRGSCPIETAILQGETMTGVSLMKIVLEMDAGPVYDAEKVSILPQDDAISLRRKMALAGIPLLERHLPSLLQGTAIPTPQDSSLATYTHLLKKSDGLLNFVEKTADELACQVRAFISWPTSFFEFHGEMIKVGKAEVTPYEGKELPGSFLGIHRHALEIVTKNGVLRCLELQRPTKKMLPAELVWRSIMP